MDCTIVMVKFTICKCRLGASISCVHVYTCIYIFTGAMKKDKKKRCYQKKILAAYLPPWIYDTCHPLSWFPDFSVSSMFVFYNLSP